VASDFADLLAANAAFAETFDLAGFDGVALSGVAVVTCMDSRINPLRMLGLQPGDAKIFRNPGGRVTNAALDAMVLGVHLLGVERILIVPHTRCAMAMHSEAELRALVTAASGQDAAWTSWSVVTDRRQPCAKTWPGCARIPSSPNEYRSAVSCTTSTPADSSS